MGPELSTAAADQNFAWICIQHQDLRVIGSILIFRTKIIWSGPEFGLVRSGYLYAASVIEINNCYALYRFVSSPKTKYLRKNPITSDYLYSSTNQFGPNKSCDVNRQQLPLSDRSLRQVKKNEKK